MSINHQNLNSLACMAPLDGFLGLSNDDAIDFEQAKAVIIPFGLEASVSYGGGTANGPMAMIKASHQVELFDEHYWCEPYRKIGIATLKPFDIAQPQAAALEQIAAINKILLNHDKFPMTFGGEHALTAGAIRPFVEKYPDLAILHFDAHADLRDGYGGEHYSHAAAIRRCLDYNPQHEQIPIASFGIRNISAEEVPFLEQNQERIHIFWAKDKAHWNIKPILELFKNRPIYLTFDIDGFDASLMPATGTPEPGGLFWNETIEIIQAVSQAGNIVGADINELAPVAHLHSCDFLAAKLAYKILSAAFNIKSSKEALSTNTDSNSDKTNFKI